MSGTERWAVTIFKTIILSDKNYENLCSWVQMNVIGDSLRYPIY